MKDIKHSTGHLAAIFSILVWGTTFISTKVLLETFTPIEILFMRFIIGYFALFLLYPHRLKIQKKKEEIYFIFSGLCGVTLYFLFENIALTLSLTSNVSVIVSIAPFFTAILASIFLKEEKIKGQFMLGFGLAIIGIIAISFNGKFLLKLNPLGDILACLAAVVWAIYSILIKKISHLNYNTIQTTRRIFFYGLLFMIPALFFSDFHLQTEDFMNVPNLLNIIYLGLGASAICFVTWNFSLKVLGVVKTSVYIYIIPVITVITSALILKEQITWASLLGTVLTMTGLFVSENRIFASIFKKNSILSESSTD
jgi:drug/metabolite transporter (DMT)-like permease